MKVKDLEITLSLHVQNFINPKSEFEQYLTPPDLSASLVMRAYHLGDISDRNVIDLCCGTGMLGIAASIMGANVTSVDIDGDALRQLRQSANKLQLNINTIQKNIFLMKAELFDTVLINPPFGFQQDISDMKFIEYASKFANTLYAIHDGSPANEKNLPELYLKIGFNITEMYYHDFIIANNYKWHTKKRKKIKVLVVRAIRSF